jgi:hypothetical protein
VGLTQYDYRTLKTFLNLTEISRRGCRRAMPLIDIILIIID